MRLWIEIRRACRRLPGLAVLMVCAANAPAVGNYGVSCDGGDEAVIPLTEGRQQVMPLSFVPARVAVGNPDIADVSVTPDGRQVIVTANKPGSTSLLIWHDARSRPQRCWLLRVAPASPTTPPERPITGRFDTVFEHDARVPVKKNDPAPADTSTVALGGTQIQADIKVVEVNRTALMEAGFFFGKHSPNTTIAVAPPGTLSGVETGGGATASAAGSAVSSLLLQSAGGFLPFAEAFQLVFGNSQQGWLSAVSLLEQNGYAYVLAEPSLVVMSGQTASFLAGGEFPVPVVQGGATSGAVSVQYQEFGVRLMLTPTLLARDRIAMKVAPEVSELDQSIGVQSGGTRVPGLRVRRTDTTIELGDGESFVISGLISESTIANEDKLPWLGDIPYIGAFFRSKRFQKDDKELLMVVTPHIVHPLRKDVSLPRLPGEEYRRTDPDYAEFLFHNQRPSRRPRGAMEGFSR